MSTKSDCIVFIGNLDERVTDRVLYDILIQSGRVVDLCIPRDKETDQPKGYAFARYETEEIANYAVKLYSGVVTLYNRTLKFSISGQDKPSPNKPDAKMTTSKSPLEARVHAAPNGNIETTHHPLRLSTPCRFSDYRANYSQVPISPIVMHQYNGHRSNFNGQNYDYSRHSFGTFDSIKHSRPSRYDGIGPITYSDYWCLQ